MKTDRRGFLAGSLATLGSFAARGDATLPPGAGPEAGVQVATFVADITTPIGEPLAPGSASGCLPAWRASPQ